MKKARKGDTVIIDFSGLMENGTILSAPLTFTIGNGDVFPAVENAVIGLSPGEQARNRVPPQMVFGVYREELIREIERNELPEGEKADVGAWLEIVRPDGEVLKGVIQKVSGSSITINANHPLAGNHLEFSARLIEILR